MSGDAESCLVLVVSGFDVVSILHVPVALGRNDCGGSGRLVSEVGDVDVGDAEMEILITFFFDNHDASAVGGPE